MIEQSVRCFAWGVVGLLPLLGLPFAVHALVTFCRLHRRAPSQRNPAERYLLGGAVFAGLGLAITLVLALCLAISLIRDIRD